MPHIKIDIEGDIPDKLIEEETVDIFETEFYKDTKARTTPGDNLKIYRQNKGLTQKELGKLYWFPNCIWEPVPELRTEAFPNVIWERVKWNK